MRRVMALMVAALLTLGIAPGAEGHYTAHLGPLHAAALALRAQVPADVTGKAKKRAKSLDKLVKTLSKTSSDLAGDLNINRKAASLVVRKKLFAEEEIAIPLDDALGAFWGELSDAEADARARLLWIGESKHRKAVVKRLDKYDRFVGSRSSQANAARVASDLVKAHDKLRVVVKKLRKAEDRPSGPPCAEKPGTLTADSRLDETSYPVFESSYVMAQIRRDPSAGGATRISVRAVGPHEQHDGYVTAKYLEIDLQGEPLKGEPFIGPGEYEVDSVSIQLRYNARDRWPEQVGTSGTITLTEVDLATGRIAGEFDVHTSNFIAFSDWLRGSFEADCVRVCDSCDPSEFPSKVAPR